VIVLASASPRRARILRELGVAFRVEPADIDESLQPGEDGADAALRLARAKAARVAASTKDPVLAADTVVLCDGAILNKPESADDARRMLRLLSGRAHEVVTGVALHAQGRAVSGIERTEVRFAPLTDDEVRWYVDTGEPMDKAGAYHVDGRAALFIESVQGSPSNVAGLPVRLLLRLGREAGIPFGPPGTTRA
jgi:septum formation protein